MKKEALIELATDVLLTLEEADEQGESMPTFPAEEEEEEEEMSLHDSTTDEEDPYAAYVIPDDLMW